MSTINCDIAVIGSGPGGAVSACLLAEAGRDVVLLEEGPELPFDEQRQFSVETMEQKYRNGGLTASFGSPKTAYVEGRVVGGGSEVNSGLYHRPPSDILEEWRTKFQIERFSDADLAPHFEACERELCVGLSRAPHPAAGLMLQRGGEKLGWRVMEVPRWIKWSTANGEAVGERQTMSRSYLPRAIAAGCRIIPNFSAQRFQREAGGFRISARTSTGETREVRSQNLFVCAGAIQTPALLRRSGVRRLIGDSFEVHPTVKIVAEFAEPISGTDTGVPYHQVKEFSPAMSFGCSVSTPPYLALGLLNYPEELRRLRSTWRRMAVFYVMVKPKTSGRVRALPGRDGALAFFSPAAADLEQLAEGLKRLSELLFQAGAVRLFPSIRNFPALSSPADISKIPKSLPRAHTELMTIHLFSSCPMGERKEVCPVGSFGEVYDVPGLYVSDASIICSAPAVNPQGTVMALARRNALAFLNEKNIRGQSWIHHNQSSSQAQTAGSGSVSSERSSKVSRTFPG